MMENDTFQLLQKPINKIDTVIHDPFLSQFKYHFIIKKLPIFHLINDKFKWNQLLSNLYKGFNAQFMGHNSIHIVHVFNVYPQLGIVDLIVGFRRDQHALKFHREIQVFQHQSQKYQVEAAQGFKTYLDVLNQKHRQQTAERQRMRAQQSQILKNFEEDSQKFQPAKAQTTFMRQSSNSISQYHQKFEASAKPQPQEQGQIVDSAQERVSKRKNSSESSYESNSVVSDRSELKKQTKIQVKESPSFTIKSDNVNRQKISISERSKRKQDSSSRSPSRRSSRSRSSSRSKKYSSRYKKDRYERSRDKRYHNRNSRSKGSSSSREKGEMSNRAKQFIRHYSFQQKRNFTQRDDRYGQQRRYEENRKYQLPQPLNRTYSGGYDDRFRQCPSDYVKKFSNEPYNNYRAPANRYGSQYYDYPKPNPSQGYNYYKSSQNYPYPPPSQGQQPINPNNTTLQKSTSQSQYEYPNKNSYYNKNQGYNQ